ncbi:MAG TPA: hypothetical protein VEQ58_04655 [Polyangiaceae bacterium]|nr:hypothetical protein [Polyangiaceae bacterium]
MELLELCSLQSTSPASGRVPPWTLGCFRRRSITFFNGESDDTTQVFWLQSRGLTADLRLAAERPRPESRELLAQLSLAELSKLAEAEGGVSPTRFEPDAVSGVELSGTMHWPDWTAFQLHAKWPEPGNLRRVGDCLIEYAPSGAYVEDWRLQTSGDGPLVGLSLLDERDATSGAVLHRGGGLVVAGDHALFVRGRAESLPAAARLSDLLERAAREPKLLDLVFGFEASYARRDSAGRYVITASTLPWREGKPLLSLGGFAVHDGVVTQKARENGRGIERRFQIDTLEPSYEDWLATPATAAAVSWLGSEATLLRAARKL